MFKVFVGIPIHRTWARESQKYFQDNLTRPSSVWKLHTLATLYEESLIQRARHNLMLQFLESDADYLFFLDDDIVLMNDNTIETLIKANKDIIGGLYIMKKPPHVPVLFPYESEYPDFTGENPVLVRYASTGCLLISRRVVEDVFKKFRYPFECYEAEVVKFKGNTTEIVSKEKIYLSEDWAFCDRANMLGFRCYVHPKPLLGHLGTYAFSINDWYAMREQK